MIRYYNAIRYRLFLCAVLNTAISFGAIVIQGDPAATAGTSFSFPILTHASSPLDDTVYVGALATGGQTFALSKLLPGLNNGSDTSGNQFISFAPQTVTLDFQAGQLNPIYNQGILLLDVLTAAGKERPVVVTTAQQSNLYLVEQLTQNNPLSVYSVTNIADASGNPSNGIIGIAATDAGRSGVFATVLPQGSSTFGDPGSGVALIDFTQVTIDEGNNAKKTTYTFTQVAAQVDSSAIAAAPLNRTSTFLAITDPLTSLTNVVDMYWDTGLQCLFIAVQASAGINANDGAYGVVVAQVINNAQVAFSQIAPATIFTAGAQNEIIGGVAAGAQVSIQKVAVMHTSTKLDYLIVVGGNGGPDAMKSNVYALPLVNTMDYRGEITDAVIQGTLADVTSTPVSVFVSDPSRIPSLVRREFPQAATTPSQIFTSGSIQAQVGQGALPAGAISDMVVAQDTVFVSVSMPVSAAQLPGIYYSQALFDSNGAVKNWTQWRRAGGTTLPIFGMNYNPHVGNITFLTGTDASSINTVEKTIWSSGDPNELGPLGTFLMSYFVSANGGIQGLQDFPLSTPGLSSISVMAATGSRGVTLIETGFINGSGAYVPNAGQAWVNNNQSFLNGQLINPNAQILVIGGDVLNNLDAIVASEIGTANNNGWFFVGGTGGLAVLANPDGTGWNATTGIQPSFTNLNGMSFKTIGTYTFVRCLHADGNFLYVLTDTTFDRIDMSASNFATNTLSITTLATSQALQIALGNGTLLASVVSEKFALLSTTGGLFRVGNGADVRSASSPTAMSWTPVTVNESAGSVIQLLAVSPTGRSQDVARSGGGSIYALNGYTGQSRGQINRFAVADVTSGPITNSSIQPYPDIFIQNIPSCFKNVGTFANQCATDGSLNLYSRSANIRSMPFVKNIQPGSARNDVPVIFDIANNSTISCMLRTFASGSWMVAGDFVRFNE
ncbi:MAG: hypothetical protein ACHQVS_01290 [Candidatus Babeliales bacterium]